MSFPVMRFLDQNRFEFIEQAKDAKRQPHLLLAIIVAVLTVLLAALIGGIMAVAVMAALDPQIMESLQTGAMNELGAGRMGLYLLLSFVFIFPILWAWLRFFAGRSLFSLGFRGTRRAFKFLRGAAFGLLAMSLITLLLWLGGAIEVASATPLSTSWLAGLPALMLIAGWLVQGTAEEAVSRGFLMQSVGARHGIWVGVLVSTLVFSIGHGLNANVTPLFFLNLVLYSLFAAFYTLREGGLWGIAGFHGIWNLAQGHIYGFAVSGEMAGSATILTFENTGPAIVTGGQTGVEGGLAATLGLGVCLASTLLLKGGFSPLTADGAPALGEKTADAVQPAD